MTSSTKVISSITSDRNDWVWGFSATWANPASLITKKCSFSIAE